jgi:hypothetical protein
MDSTAHIDFTDPLGVLEGKSALYFTDRGTHRLRFLIPKQIGTAYPQGTFFKIDRDGSHDFWISPIEGRKGGALLRADSDDLNRWVLDLVEHKPFYLTKGLPEFGTSPAEYLYDATKLRILVRLIANRMNPVSRRKRAPADPPTEVITTGLPVIDRLRAVLKTIADVETATGYKLDIRDGKPIFRAVDIEL